ncbi:FAD/NAD(P)-binding protein [Rubellimicrobium aerolatum]|uniref:FAD/NAD(P)-binding protein n=1 Tax=Rubellimicrobium aerolatum TaxID=490979 RepID=A0ABW0S820_9RHOB|nr:putative NAD(P)/FAD-binding protein YdhS [Rubellimicrobium aerolatum]
MRPRIAVVGSGPTGLYTLQHLLASSRPLDVTLLEAQPEAGWGMPYSPELNGHAMLANIASVEIPPLTETLVAWLVRQPDAELQRLGVPRERIDERAFYPRVVLGEYFRAQLARLLERAGASGHAVTVLASHDVTDIELREADVLLTAERPEAGPLRLAFDHAVMATGHTHSDATETRPGWFASPYPTSALRAIAPGPVGVLGTSLSAIDAAVAVAGAHGAFLREPSGVLGYHPKPGTQELRLALMSRKGLLPEADFFFPIPYEDNLVCTPEAVDALVASGRPDLLDAAFELFREELVRADPDYAARIGLSRLDADGFAPAYFAEREGRDPFAWAALNLAEAQANYAREVVVPWRYAILRMHEVIARAVPHLSAGDLGRFHAGWKAVFVDDYATVPHESIERLLALRRADRIEVIRLGADYRLEPAEDGPGARLAWEGGERRLTAYVDATGQRALDAADLPFPTLRAQGAVREARAVRTAWDEEGAAVETGGVDLDAAFRPVNGLALHRGLHLLALPFLLHLRPFHQGLTSAEELGRTVAQAIRAEVEGGGPAGREAEPEPAGLLLLPS